MESNFFIKDLKDAINHLRNNGQTTILVENLDNYIKETEEIIKNSKSQNAEEEKHNRGMAQQNFENEIEITKIRSNENLEMFKSVIEAGLTALKSAIIINGGAAISLLAFIGGIINYSSQNNVILISGIGKSLLIFIIGAGCAGVATGVRYLTQFLYSIALEETYQKKSTDIKTGFYYKSANCLNIISILLGTSSFVAFFLGGWVSYTVFSQIH